MHSAIHPSTVVHRAVGSPPRRDTKNAEGSGSDQENFKSGHTVQPTQPSLDRRAASPFQYQHNALMSGASEVR